MDFSSYMSDILESVASTELGQFFIKKVDLLLWTVEKPAKYVVDGQRKGDRNLPWIVFWTVLINLQIFRIVYSTVALQFHKKRLESKDIVTNIQTWRRTLRSIRFRGLRSIRQSKHGKEKANGSDGKVPPPMQSSKKRNHDEMLDHDLLEELMNKTYSDNDQTDSTFMMSKCSQGSTNGSSNDGQSLSEEDYHSPVKSKNGVDSSLQDTLPVSASDSEHHEPNMSSQSYVSGKTSESTFVSTVDDTEESTFSMTEDDAHAHPKPEGNGNVSAGSTVQSNGSSKVGKESLNQPIDPVDVMMSKLVEMENNGKIHTKKGGKNQHGNKKKRNFSLTTSQENVNSQNSLKESKSQDAMNKF